MDILFKIFSRRTLILLIAAALAWLTTQSLLPYVKLWLQIRYVPQVGQSSGGREIDAANERLEATRVLHRYGRVLALLERARSEGFPVAGLQSKAQAALRLNDAQNRPRAIKMLVEVEMNVPRKKTLYRPAPAAEEGLDIPQVRPVRKTKTKRRKR